MTYKLTNENNIIHPDGFSFPASETNRHYRRYLEWLAEGNTPLPADPEPPPSSAEVALTSAKDWLDANPGARQIWELSIGDLETQIVAQIEALYPNATAGVKNKERLLRMATVLLIRREAKALGLAD